MIPGKKKKKEKDDPTIEVHQVKPKILPSTVSYLFPKQGSND